MNCSNTPIPGRQPDRHSSRASIEMAFKRFFPVVAGAWLLLAEAGASLGGIDDPGNIPSPGRFGKLKIGVRHCPDYIPISPCYGYHPTSWRQWPACCVGYAAPPALFPPESPQATQQNSPPGEVLTPPAGIPTPKPAPPPPEPQPSPGPSLSPPPIVTPDSSKIQ